MAWALVVRTAVFDELLLDRVLHHGVDLVLNLAAGLDTRAWRLALPESLHWVDVDLPRMIEYKIDMMRGERPGCRDEALAGDLTDAAARRALFHRLGAAHQCILVVTEGLLIYLPSRMVADLARFQFAPAEGVEVFPL